MRKVWRRMNDSGVGIDENLLATLKARADDYFLRKIVNSEICRLKVQGTNGSFLKGHEVRESGNMGKDPGSSLVGIDVSSWKAKHDGELARPSVHVLMPRVRQPSVTDTNNVHEMVGARGCIDAWEREAAEGINKVAPFDTEGREQAVKRIVRRVTPRALHAGGPITY